jgi:aminoglycoside/choline kinase family phosphotransferase
MGVIGTDARENNAFIRLSEHFRSKGINVPQVYAVAQDGMTYIQEDLGNRMLSDEVAAVLKDGGYSPDSPVVELLCRTMSKLPEIQFKGAEGLDFSVCYPQPAFDHRMVMFDLNYFKYCFLKPSGLEFDEVRLQDEFELLAKDLLEDSGNTFLYRDFNARNVMIKDGEPYFIDFQGGRRGPIYYDVASFVWQARFRYPQWLKERMVDSYLEALKEYKEYTDADRVGFDGRLRLSVLFRTLQVLGAYGFRGLVEQKAQFIVKKTKELDDLEAKIKASPLNAEKKEQQLAEINEAREALKGYGKPAGKGGQGVKLTPEEEKANAEKAVFNADGSMKNPAQLSKLGAKTLRAYQQKYGWNLKAGIDRADRDGNK